jgi:hypothetical protein
MQNRAMKEVLKKVASMQLSHAECVKLARRLMAEQGIE